MSAFFGTIRVRIVSKRSKRTGKSNSSQKLVPSPQYSLNERIAFLSFVCHILLINNCGAFQFDELLVNLEAHDNYLMLSCLLLFVLRPDIIELSRSFGLSILYSSSHGGNQSANPDPLLQKSTRKGTKG